MAFDLSTAKPVSGFDLSTAKPVDQSDVAPLSKTERIARGLRDPLDAGAQLLANIVPEGAEKSINEFNNWLARNTGLVSELPEGGINQQISEQEREYQARRKAGGEEGLDAYRLAGNIAATIPLAAAAPAATTLGARVAAGSALGGVMGGLQPVTEGNFWEEKAMQAGSGAIAGAVIPAALGGVSRVISPKASTSAAVQTMKQAGIQPTVGQVLGGRANIAEEKLQSLPIVGDVITRGRGKALEQFNSAAINKALEPIGEKVDDIGQTGVRKAGDILSKYYDSALNKITGVKFDQQFNDELSTLKQMADNLTPQMRRRFNRELQDKVMGRMSPNGSMLPEVYKSVESDLGKIAGKFAKSNTATEQELGDALKQLQALMKQQMVRSNPHVAEMIQKADAGWANLTRIEHAARSAKNNSGVFTPAQLNAAVQRMDRSVRGRGVARGTALMQDFASDAQTVLGGKYPDSGTAGRVALGLGSIGALGGATGAGWIDSEDALKYGAILGLGSLGYTGPAQRVLSGMVSSRPEVAAPIAAGLRRLSPYAAVSGSPFVYALSEK